jgi:hypothetical protein
MPTTRFVVLMFANLAPHKGQITALRALHRLIARGVAIERGRAGPQRIPVFRAEHRMFEIYAAVAGGWH